MSNRKLLLSGEDGELLKGITIALATFDHADTTPIENIVEAGPPTEFGFGTWAQEDMSGSTTFQCEFDALTLLGSSGRDIARANGFSRNILPISSFCDLGRGGVPTSLSVTHCLFMDNTTSLATLASEAEATGLNHPVGVGVTAYDTGSGSTMHVAPWYRAPGDSDATILDSTPNLEAPIQDGFNGGGSARIGFTWQKNKIWAWWEPLGGGIRTNGDIFDLDPAPWSGSVYNAAGLVFGCGLQSGRMFMTNYYIQR